MKVTFTLICIAAFVLCVSSIPIRIRRDDVNQLLVESAEIAAKEQADVDNFLKNAKQDVSVEADLLQEVKGDEPDAGKLKADISQEPGLYQRANNDVQKFQDQWSADMAASGRLAKRVESANLPAADMAVVKQGAAIENEADAEVKNLQSGWRDLAQSGEGLDQKVVKGQGSDGEDLRQAETLERAAAVGLETFANNMEGIRAKGNALVEKYGG